MFVSRLYYVNLGKDWVAIIYKVVWGTVSIFDNVLQGLRKVRIVSTGGSKINLIV